MQAIKALFHVSFTADSWDSSERVEAGLQAGRLCAGSVRHLPLLLHHDRVQRLHLRQPAHVSGRLDSVSQNAPS